MTFGEFTVLPKNVIDLLITYFDGLSITKLAQTSQSFKKICEAEEVWKRLYHLEVYDSPVTRFGGNYRLCWKYFYYIQTQNDQVPELLSMVENNQNRLESIKKIRKMLEWPFDQPELPKNTDQVFLQVLVNGTVQEKTQVALCLTSMAANNAPGSNKMKEYGNALVNNLLDTDRNLVCASLDALRNIAGDGLPNRDYLVNVTSVMAPLVTVIKREISAKNKRSIEVLTHCAMAVTAMCRKKPAIPTRHVSIVLPTLVKLIYYDDNKLLEHVLWAYSGITEQSSGPHLQAVAQQGIYKRLLELVKDPAANLYYPAMRVIGNLLVSSNEEHTRAFLDLGVLQVLEKQLNHVDLHMRKEAMWSLSNIAATSPACIQNLIDSGIVPLVIRKLTEDDDFVRKEAAFTVANSIWKGNPGHARTMVLKNGCLSPMISLAENASASSSDSAKQIVELTMETFENLLKSEIPREDVVIYSSMINNLARGFLQRLIITNTNGAATSIANNVLRRLSAGQVLAN